MCTDGDKWVLVTTVFRDLRLRKEKRPSICKVAAKYTEWAVADSRKGVALKRSGCRLTVSFILSPSAARWKNITALKRRESYGNEVNDEGDRVGALECVGFEWSKGAGN